MSSSPHDPHRDPAVRLSDDERNSAMAALSRAFSEGRLNVDEYDSRVKSVVRADVSSDLESLFTDLPQNADGSGKDFDTMYSAQEVAAAHKASKNSKLGVLLLSTIASLVAIPVVNVATGTGLGALFLFVIPTVWVLLYILKIGPEQWYSPSPRQIERERLREIKSADAIRSAERKAKRQEIAGELTTDAMSFAKRSLDKFTKK